MYVRKGIKILVHVLPTVEELGFVPGKLFLPSITITDIIRQPDFFHYVLKYLLSARPVDPYISKRLKREKALSPSLGGLKRFYEVARCLFEFRSPPVLQISTILYGKRGSSAVTMIIQYPQLQDFRGVFQSI